MTDSSLATGALLDVPAARDYLQIGLAPDLERAIGYISRLVENAAPLYGAVSFPELLTTVVEDHTWARGAREIAIPLTGGYDSRGLLGAALRIYPAAVIHCMTIGAPDNPDLAVAKRVCAKLGVNHTAVHPDHFRWDIDHAVSEARKIYMATGGRPPIDGLLMYDTLANAIPKGMPVLTGYLADVLSGSRIPAASRMADPILDFLQGNAAVAGMPTRYAEWLPRLSPILVESEDAFAALSGATPHDRMDFGLRQRLRARTMTVDRISAAVAVYEDPRLVGFWLSVPLSKRRSQALYRSELTKAFPEVFGGGSPSIVSLAKKWAGPYLPAGVRSMIVRRLPMITAERGNPASNAAMMGFLQQLTDAFDARRIVPRSFGADARDLPSGQVRWRFDNVRWAASAEIYLRAGVLTA